MAEPRATSPTHGTGVSRFFKADSDPNRRSFVPVPTAEQVEEMVVMEYSMDPKKRYKVRLMVYSMDLIKRYTVRFMVYSMDPKKRYMVRLIEYQIKRAPKIYYKLSYKC